jgi:hypothetical protein
LIQLASGRTDFPSDSLAMAVNQRPNQLRRLNPDQRGSIELKLALKKEIAYVAMTYCGADLEINNKAFQECATTFVSQFKAMSIAEIRIAFQFAAGGKLKDVSLTSYWGKFPVGMFADVCKKYVSFRDAAFFEYEKEREREEWEKLQLQKEAANEAARQATIDKFKEMLEFGANFEKWEDVPFNFGEVLYNAELLQKDSDLWREVKKNVTEDFKASVKYGKAWVGVVIGDIHSCRNLLRKIEAFPDDFRPELEPTAKVQYFRRLAWNRLNENANKV